MDESLKFPLPRSPGDAYLLIGYPSEGFATVAFATFYQPAEGGKLFFWLLADDGDFYPCHTCEEAYDETGASKIVFLKPAASGVAEWIIALPDSRAWAGKVDRNYQKGMFPPEPKPEDPPAIIGTAVLAEEPDPTTESVRPPTA